MWSVNKTQVREAGDAAGKAVVLLDGIGPNVNCLGAMQRALVEEGYRTARIDYPSTRYSLDVLAREHLAPAIERLALDPEQPVHFVTMSMGGILARVYLRHYRPANLGRVVMLAPPNHGSEVADWLQGWWFYRWRFGPAGQELTTASDSVPNALGPANYPVGVIAGDRSLDPWFGWRFNGPHDGKVSVASARLDGMAAFAVVPASHYGIMYHPRAIELTRRFLHEGRFE